MNILVAKNGSQLGPFSETDLRAKLASGEFAPTDYGWHEGMTAWSPLSQLLGSAPASAPAVPSVPSLQKEPSAAPQGQMAPAGYAPQPANSPYPAAYQQGVTPAWGAPGASGYAGFWLRVAAFILDYIVVGIPLYIVRYIISMVISDPIGLALIATCINLPVFWFYFASMESSPNQATLGKKIVGLKVTDENGNRISFGQATGRFFGKIVSGIILYVGFMMAGFTQRKQALHDIMAHTLVVKR